MSGRGGKRTPGPGKMLGRPPGSKNKKPKNWQDLGTSVSPEIKDWLDKKKEEGFQVNILVNRALRYLMARER